VVAVVEVVVAVVDVVVVAAPQSWKQHEHEVETTPCIAAQADALFTLAQLGAVGSWQVTPPFMPHDFPWASQLVSSALHVGDRLLLFWLMHFWKAPELLPVHCPPVQQFDCMAA